MFLIKKDYLYINILETFIGVKKYWHELHFPHPDIFNNHNMNISRETESKNMKIYTGMIARESII